MTALLAAGAIRAPIQTSSGPVTGIRGRDSRVAVFKGLPYAAPPIAERRWRAPEPPASWNKVRQADHFPNACIQDIVKEHKPWTYEFMAHEGISEDCLYLNVWTAARNAKAKLPVLVYIHGGAFREGSGAVPTYDGEGLAKKGVVVVTINYRLGLLGFFAHPELTKESLHGASGNYGLLDQVAALQWVHANIAKFGGDPGRVTIAGQSAGSMSVHALVASPLTKGLFQRAIAESGGSTISGGMSRKREDAEQAGVKFAASKGAKTIAQMREMSPDDLGATGNTGFSVIVDGYLLPASIPEIIGRGSQNDVPILTGGNADEGGASPNPEVKLETFRQQAKQRHGDSAAEFLKLYPAGSDAEAAKASNDAARDQQRVSTHLWALQRAKTSKTPAFTYFWNHVLPGPDAARYGAFHSSEIPYAYNALAMSDRPFTADDRRIAEQMSSYWANFAAKGDPNGKHLPQWRAVSQGDAVTLQIGDQTSMIPIAGSAEKLDFWRHVLLHPRPGR